MCGIIIWYKESDIINKFTEQKDRWRDWLWIISIWEKKITHIITGKEEEYIEELKAWIKDWWLNIIHHRKKSVWEVVFSQVHPFVWDKYIVMQNGTMTWFINDFSTIFPTAKVDSEMLSMYLNSFADNFQEVIEMLDVLSNDYDLWIIIITEKSSNKTLIYLDWTRESNIKIKKDKLRFLSNYSKWGNEWYKNIWYLIVNEEWKVLDIDMVNWLNKFPFTEKVLVNGYGIENEFDDYFKWLEIYWDVNDYLSDYLSSYYWVNDIEWYALLFEENFPLNTFISYFNKYEKLQKQHDDLNWNWTTFPGII